MRTILFIFLASIVQLTTIAQNKTEVYAHKETSFSKVERYSRSLDKLQYSKVLEHLSSKLKEPVLNKKLYKLWNVGDDKNELGKIQLYDNEIRIMYRSTSQRSEHYKFINDLIVEITDIIDNS